MTKKDLTIALKENFGYNSFRPYQEEIIEAILDHQDIVSILPTGAGKSLCFQLPAILLPGVAVVISPLIALMQDQVYSLEKNDISSAFINSTLSYAEIDSILNNIDKIKLLYIAPERFKVARFMEQLKNINISFFVIDESHLISQWGHAFRPEYRNLAILKKEFPDKSIAAFTATATPRVQKDMAIQLEMKNPKFVLGSFNRDNLTIRIQDRLDYKEQLFSFLNSHQNESGIIYAATRKRTDQVRDLLNKNGYNVVHYHAGLSAEERERNQQLFIEGSINVIVATIAFGMGINKPDVRYVVHLDMPQTIEQYYQEIGRAGRDGLPSECLMLFSAKEIFLYNTFLNNYTDEIVKTEMKHKLNRMVSLCSSAQCRRIDLLNYFGEKAKSNTCGQCDNCLDDIEKIDGTEIAQKIISAVYRLSERFGITHVTDVLRGSKKQSVLSRGHEKLTVYSIMDDSSEHDLKYYIMALITMNHLKISEGEYPLLQMTDSSNDVLSGNNEVFFKKRKEKKAKAKKVMANLSNSNPSLLSELKELRRILAKKDKVPPYYIFHDKTLLEMSSTNPSTTDQMLTINGVGKAKLKKYGNQFLVLIKKYL